MLNFEIDSTIDLYDNLDNFRAIFQFLGSAVSDAELSKNEKLGAYLCFTLAGKLLDECLDYIDTLPK